MPHIDNMMTRVNSHSKEQIYSGGINLRKDKFSLNGKVVDKEIVGHQDSVGIVAVIGRSVILVTQYRHVGKTRWSLKRSLQER